MGLSRLTALIIKNSPKVKASAKGPAKENGKWAGWILLDEGKWHPLLNTEAIYKTEKAAVRAMKELIKEIKESEL